MTKLLWDQNGQRFFETGVSKGVLYLSTNGVYTVGYAWNGLTAVTESPSGAEATPQYADNIKYLNLQSAEEFGGTIEAFTYPPAFAQCNGEVITNGVAVGQQGRRSFGVSYKTQIGNDEKGADFGYKLHLGYGLLAGPSEKNYTSVNDTPEAMGLSWEFSSTPVEIGTVNSVAYKPSAILTVDSTQVTPANLQALEDALYGTAGTSPRLPLPAEVIAMFNSALTTATPAFPLSYVAGTGVVTIPNTTGVTYSVDGVPVTGTYTVPVASTKVVVATPAAGYKFSANADDDQSFTRA